MALDLDPQASVQIDQLFSKAMKERFPDMAHNYQLVLDMQIRGAVHSNSSAAAAGGSASLSTAVPGNARGRTFAIMAIDLTACRISDIETTTFR